MSLKDEIKFQVSEKLKINIIKMENLSGGCISNAYRLIVDNGKDLFLKVNDSVPTNMFKCEANGLNELRKADAVKVPEVIIYSEKYIVTELIKPAGKSANFFRNFGGNFAILHNYKGNSFGFYEDNYIGSNPQKNLTSGNEDKNWIEFYFNNRLLFQFKLCEKNGYATVELKSLFKKLEDKLHYILNYSSNEPSLLHGDLWSGNYMVSDKGEACIIDPAVYYGNREADLAMTKLFGGYPEEFYESYNEVYPLEDGWEYRENIYKLYHVLNHLNLFGQSYYPQAFSLIKFYL